MAKQRSRNLLRIFRGGLLALLHQESRNLTARQLAIFLTCYLESDLQTVRGLAAEMNVSRSIVSRALDRLVEARLLRRRRDPNDMRSVLIGRTLTGMQYFRGLEATLTEIIGHNAPLSQRDNTDGGQALTH